VTVSKFKLKTKKSAQKRFSIVSLETINLLGLDRWVA
jgi:hypothetical protein